MTVYGIIFLVIPAAGYKIITAYVYSQVVFLNRGLSSKEIEWITGGV